jgi:hypothetical protein
VNFEGARQSIWRQSGGVGDTRVRHVEEQEHIEEELGAVGTASPGLTARFMDEARKQFITTH